MVPASLYASAMRVELILIAAALLSAAAPGSAAAQTYAAADIQYGARLYGEQCTVCHGATGDVVAGVDLRANRFKRASTDNELRNVITNGVTGTASSNCPASERAVARRAEAWA